MRVLIRQQYRLRVDKTKHRNVKKYGNSNKNPIHILSAHQTNVTYCLVKLGRVGGPLMCWFFCNVVQEGVFKYAAVWRRQFFRFLKLTTENAPRTY